MGHHQCHLLRAAATVLQAGRAPSGRGPRLSARGGEVEKRGRGVGGGREPVSGPQLAGGYLSLPPAAGGAGGQGMGTRGGGDRGWARRNAWTDVLTDHAGS